MDTRNSSGFRICVTLCVDNNVDSRKCFIFVNEGWSKIKCVQDHIKNIFNIDEEVNIYIGDVLLPENETIKLIQPNDILIIKTIEAKKDKCSKQRKMCPTDVHKLPTLSSTPKEKTVLTNGSSPEKLLSNCLEELLIKKEQIVNEIAQDADSVQNESNEVETLFTIPPKKRKRKHKKKSKLLENSLCEEANTNTSDLMIIDSVNSSSQHIHFSDADSEEVSHAHSSPKVNGNKVEEFRSSLLNLVNKPASQKVFARKSETPFTIKREPKDFEATSLEDTPPVKVDENKSEIINSTTFEPKVGDLISFKKIKLGNDYTPQESNEIVGEVLNVEGTAGSYLVVFTIKEGAEEFEDPSGKFSIEVDEDKCEDNKISIAEIRWNDILEPRLKRRIQL